MAMLSFMDDNMDDNRVPADQSQAFLQRAQSQSASISPWRVVAREPFYFS